MFRHEPNTPIADGILFDELSLIKDKDAIRIMSARELIYLTEFRSEGTLYGGSVIAKDSFEAAKIADSRGLGEVIIGVLEEIVEDRGSIGS